MIIKFLGSGSEFVKIKENYQSNILISKSEIIDDNLSTKNLLINAGHHISESMDYYGIDPLDIHAIFISCNLTDRNGGLSYLSHLNYLHNQNKSVLFANVSVMETLWENVLKGNIGNLNDADKVNLSTYFNVKPIPPKKNFQFLNTVFTPIRLCHIIDKRDEIPSFGLKWVEDEIKFFFSGDCCFDFWRLMPFWEYAHVVFQDCEFTNDEKNTHCKFHQLCDIPEKYKKKMWLYNYSLQKNSIEQVEEKVLFHGFAGLVKKGQEFDTNLLKEYIKD